MNCWYHLKISVILFVVLIGYMSVKYQEMIDLSTQMLCEFDFGASWTILTAGYSQYNSLTKTAVFFKYLWWHKLAVRLEYCFSSGILQVPGPRSRKHRSCTLSEVLSHWSQCITFSGRGGFIHSLQYLWFLWTMNNYTEPSSNTCLHLQGGICV